MGKLKRLVWWLLLAACISTAGCYYLQTADTPMTTRFYERASGYSPSTAVPSERAQDLLVLLPGMGDGIERFEKEGLIRQLAQADLPVDAVAVNAHFGYYRSRQLLERLSEDVLQPAKALGYERIHLAGVSLGGFGGLLYWRYGEQHPTLATDISSLLLLTPYVGEPEYYQHRLNGGPAQAVGEEKNLWPWLESLPAGAGADWYLGMAESDKFYTANQTFAAFVPTEQVAIVEGGHNWDSWRALWPQLLQHLKREQFASPAEKPR